jgi:hypothetical protein
MRQILLKILILSILLSILTGCNKYDKFTNEMWLNQINNGLMIVDSDYYQNLIDFEIIKSDDDIKLSDEVTNNFVRYTLENMINIKLLEIEINLNNSNKKIDRKLAEKYLTTCINYLNSKEYKETIYEVELKENYTNKPFKIVDNCLFSQSNYNIGDLVNIDSNYFVISKKIESGTTNKYTYRLANYEDVIESVDLETSFDLNLNSIELIEDDSVEVSSNLNNTYYQKLGSFSTYRQISRKGFDIYYSISNSSFHISVAREVKDGIKVFGEYDISNIKPNIKWDYDHKLDEAYFRVDYQTQQAVGTKTTMYYDRYLDIKKLKGEKAFIGIQNVFKSKQDLVETTIPILSFKAPIPECPLFFITMELRLHIYASGKMEISLVSKNQTGIEIKNNNLRMINEHYNDVDFILHASASSTLGLSFGLSAINYKLTNIEVETGVKGKLQTIVHLYNNNNFTNIESDIPTDIVDYVSENNDKIFVCGDLSLYWLLNLQFNTNDTFLGKIGYYRKYELLDEDNQILKNKMTHIENWQFVEECTYNNVVENFTSDEIFVTTDQIILEKYSLLIREGDSEYIRIKGLPENYELKDLNYLSENILVCEINNGVVTAKIKGAANIIISTNDNKYKASISIIVQDSD